MTIVRIFQKCVNRSIGHPANSLYPSRSLLRQGCGYPPRTVCKDFTDEYALNGTTFECFVSRAKPDLVIVDLDLEQVVSICKPGPRMYFHQDHHSFLAQKGV